MNTLNFGGKITPLFYFVSFFSCYYRHVLNFKDWPCTYIFISKSTAQFMKENTELAKLCFLSALTFNNSVKHLYSANFK